MQFPLGAINIRLHPGPCHIESELAAMRIPGDNTAIAQLTMDGLFDAAKAAHPRAVKTFYRVALKISGCLTPIGELSHLGGAQSYQTEGPGRTLLPSGQGNLLESALAGSPNRL